MRKVVGICLFIFLLTLMYGCSKINDDDFANTVPPLIEDDGLVETDELDETDDPPLNTFSEYGYEYEMLSYSNPLFNAEISNIVFDVVQRKVCFYYNIIDYSSTASYYFVYGYEEKEHRPFHPLGRINFSPSTNYCLDLLYNEEDPEGYVTIEMGRYPSSVHVIGEVEASNSVGFRYRIKSIESRGKINDFNLYLSRDDLDVYHKANVALSIEDPDQTITSVRLVLSVVFMDNYLISEQTIPVDASMRVGDMIIINQIQYGNLSPTVSYQISAYINGNDGLYPYENTKLGIAQTRMSDGYFVRLAFHDFYCEIHSSIKSNDSTNIYLNVVNEGIYQIDGQTPVLFLNFYHNISDEEPYYSIKLQNGINDLQLSNPEINLYDLIKVEDEARTLVLSQAGIYAN